MAKNYAEIGKNVLGLVGGQENVSAFQHCSTRLRFKIHDMEKVDTERLKALSGVAGIKPMKDGIHIIIGQDVDEVYNEINKLADFTASAPTAAETSQAEVSQPEEKKKNIVLRVLSAIADCLVPAIPALIAAGLMNAIVTLVATFGVLDTAGTSYQILNIMASAPIYFLPFMVAIGASKKFNASMFLAVATTAVMLYPGFTAIAGEGQIYGSLFGLPVRLVDYSSQLVPIILMVLVLSYVEKLVKKIIPKAISVFAVPLVTYIIVTFITLLIAGPLGAYLGDLVTMAVEWMVGRYNWLFGLLFAGVGNFFIASGMHYGMIPIVIANFAKNGYDTFYAGACFAGAMALAGAVLAVAVKSKNKDVKALASSTGFTALLGISEPALYGVFFQYPSVMIAASAAGAIGGCLSGIIGVNSYGMAPAGLTSIAVLAGPTFVNAIIVILLSFILGFGISYVLFKDKKTTADGQKGGAGL